MKADRGRRLASGDRERALLNRNRPSLSTSYGGRKRGSKPRSRRSASSSEEHRFYSDDDEFEHEVIFKAIKYQPLNSSEFFVIVVLEPFPVYRSVFEPALRDISASSPLRTSFSSHILVCVYVGRRVALG